MNDSFYIRPFIPSDWQDIDLRQWERENINFDSVLAISGYGTLFTVFGDGVILAIMGFWKKWEGVYEVYVYPSNTTPRYPVYYVKRVKSLLKTIAASHNMRRQQAISLASERNDRWMKALGFECEGTMRQFTERREDCKMWARFNS